MEKSTTPPLTPAQREIMEIVWQRGEVAVSDVRSELADRKRDVARNTVQTMMTRLEERGWLQHREQGRTFLFSAARQKKQSLGVKVAQMVDQFFAGSPEEMVTALIEYRGLSSVEANRIREMIANSELKSDHAPPRKKSRSKSRRGKKS